MSASPMGPLVQMIVERLRMCAQEYALKEPSTEDILGGRTVRYL